MKYFTKGDFSVSTKKQAVVALICIVGACVQAFPITLALSGPLVWILEMGYWVAFLIFEFVLFGLFMLVFWSKRRKVFASIGVFFVVLAVVAGAIYGVIWFLYRDSVSTAFTELANGVWEKFGAGGFMDQLSALWAIRANAELTAASAITAGYGDVFLEHLNLINGVIAENRLAVLLDNARAVAWIPRIAQLCLCAGSPFVIGTIANKIASRFYE